MAGTASYLRTMPATLELFAACQPGLEPLLERELRDLGASPKALPGGCAFPGDLQLAMTAGLWLGTASHLLVRLATFPCRALGELQRKAAAFQWASWLREDVPIDVRATTKASRVYHTGAAVERVEAAIATALGRTPPKATSDAPTARIHVRFRDDVCTLSLDAGSTPLHQRGYRLDGRKAPLREDLAHALLLASGFTGGMALLDPFCGSGTIVIEAAALAAGLPAGRLRPPPFAHLALFDRAAWNAVPKHRPSAAAAALCGGDRDEGAVGAAAANATRAGVSDVVAFRHCALAAQPWLDGKERPSIGALVTNPPFGLRIAASGSLAPLYQTLGHRTARLSGFRVAILAHDPRLARRTGLPLRAAFTTRHGGLAVTALVGEIASSKAPA
jgi:putative N6-adenine-specific DNA methylase